MENVSTNDQLQLVEQAQQANTLTQSGTPAIGAQPSAEEIERCVVTKEVSKVLSITIDEEESKKTIISALEVHSTGEIVTMASEYRRKNNNVLFLQTQSQVFISGVKIIESFNERAQLTDRSLGPKSKQVFNSNTFSKCRW